MKNGDLVEHDGKQYRIGMYLAFEKPHRSKTNGKMVVGYGYYFDVGTAHRAGDVFAYADETYELVPRKVKA